MEAAGMEETPIGSLVILDDSLKPTHEVDKSLFLVSGSPL